MWNTLNPTHLDRWPATNPKFHTIISCKLSHTIMPCRCGRWSIMGGIGGSTNKHARHKMGTKHNLSKRDRTFIFLLLYKVNTSWLVSVWWAIFSHYNARHLKKSRSAQIVGEAEEWTTWRCGDRSQIQCPASLLWWSHKQNSSSCTSGDTNLAFGT